jgi:hypothetical protein
MKNVTKAEMESFVKAKLTSNPKWAKAALLKLFSNQTSDEQTSHETKYHNNIGFTGADARWLSSLATQLRDKGYLTDKQMKVLYRKIGKYAGQIARSSNQQMLAQQTMMARRPF